MTVAVVTSDHGLFSPRPPNVLTQRAMETAAPPHTSVEAALARLALGFSRGAQTLGFVVMVRNMSAAGSVGARG